MQLRDLRDFAQMLDKVWGLKGQTLTADQKKTYFEALGAHELAEVRAGLNAHVQDPERGQFLPMPADIIRQILRLVATDGRPGADEAWATALRSADETDTVVWTEETQQAWAAARPVFDRGDEIGARMAFRQAYDRLVAGARERRVPPVWVVSEGFDAGKRAIALTRAADLRQLPAPIVAALLPPPAVGLGDLFGRPDVPEHARQAIERFKARVAARAAEPGRDGLEKQRTADLKAEAAARVDDYVGNQHTDEGDAP